MFKTTTTRRLKVHRPMNKSIAAREGYGSQTGKKRKSATRTIPAKNGKPAIKYQVGTLHKATGTPQGKTIPKAKLKKALAGGYGAAAKKKAELAVNVFGVKTKKRKSRKMC